MPGAVDRRSLLRAAFAGVVGAFAAASCSSDRGALTAPSFGDGSAPTAATVSHPLGEIQTVAMVGDSITLGARRPLAEGFRGLGLDVRALDAANGRRIAVGGPSNASGLDVVTLLAAADPPDLWVIALGSNDVFQYTHAEEYRAAIGALLSATSATTPMVWVDTYLADDPARCDVFNQTLRDTLELRGSASVADWASVASGDGVLADGIHPTAEGEQQFSAVVMAAVEAWLG